MSKEFYDYNSKNLEYGTARIDPFYYDQPSRDFIDMLCEPLFKKAPEGFGKRSIREDEVNAAGIYIDKGDFSSSPLLATVFEDFRCFAKVYKIAGNRYPVRLKREKTEVFESYRITVTGDECTVFAGDTEGIRRAIIYMENEFQKREGAYLPKGEVKRTPYIRTRITRGFFSPTNRAPKFGDELSDEIDYYPDEYLNRLMHDGTNGIWIYTSFKALFSSEQFPEYGDGGEKRIEKLNNVVKKCARYGIKVYIFAIEPMHLVGEHAEAHRDMTGGVNTGFGQYAICTSTEMGKKYLSDSVKKLFTLVPDLGGYIDITAGERVTSCASYPEVFKTCPICSKRKLGEVLAECANIIKWAMESVAPNAEFISWTYGHKDWNESDVLDYVEKCDTGIALMQSFEENSYAEQLGKVREGKDYWLSHIGPGRLFEATAREAKRLGKTVYAKMQVCCSHEVASVPYVPVPGLIFEKYKIARELDCRGVMQCWYFGNYPSVMSKAAGELAFCNDFSDKDAFLTHLAAIYHGESAAHRIVSAWKKFEDGYSNYPLNIMFSYYGPMHDSVVWQLQLKPKDYYLPRSWQLLDEPNGDRIYEALWQGHTLEEVLSLSEYMSNRWNEGLSELTDTDEDYTVAKALGVLFESGKNILKFYELRRELGLGKGDARTLLERMRAITFAEIESSEKMISVCRVDRRLGYHSEAEGFKFFEKKLVYRMQKLRKLLDTEFPEVEKRISEGLSALEFYSGKENGKYSKDAYFMNADGERSFGKKGHTFSVKCDTESLVLTVDARSELPCTVSFEFEPLIPSPTLVLSPDGKIDFVSEVYSHHSVFGKKIEDELRKYALVAERHDGGVRYTLTVKRRLAGYVKDTPLRMNLSVGKDALKESGILLRFLAKWNEYPDTFIWLLP